MSSRTPVVIAVACVIAAAAGYFTYTGGSLTTAAGAEAGSIPAPGPISPKPGDAAATHLPAGLQFTDADGKIHPADEYRGKLLIINFWATWCGPCLHEIPALIKIQNDYGAKGVQLVGPAVDDPEEVRAQMKKLGFNYPVFVGESDAMLDLMTQLGNTSGALPFSVVVAGDGTIIKRELGEFAPVELAGLIEETLAAKP